MSPYTMRVREAMSAKLGIAESDINFEDSISYMIDVPGVVDDYNEWVDKEVTIFKPIPYSY